MRKKCNRNCKLVIYNQVTLQNCIDMEMKGLCLKKNDPQKIERIFRRIK